MTELDIFNNKILHDELTAVCNNTICGNCMLYRSCHSDAFTEDLIHNAYDVHVLGITRKVSAVTEIDIISVLGE